MISTRTATLLQYARGCNTFNNALHTSSVLNARVAVVLSGCGVLDGSEIHEASAVLVHLSRHEAEVEIFAPDIQQAHVVNHMNGHTMEKERRSVLVESARIGRKNLPALDTLKTVDFDGIIFPGGFGVAKNLSTFALDGVNMKINPDVERVLKEFRDAKKPIGMCCIAPVLVAKLFPGCEVTVGSDKEEGGRWPYFETTESICSMNSIHVKKNVTECHIDHANKIVTTPAFMCETAIHHIFDGVGLMVKSVLSLIPKKITCK